MARLSAGDERGVVYVEFLIAFFPLFLMFLALCQLALVAAAEAVVRHAAYAGARSAIVVLEDDPERFDGAERGSLSQGNARRVAGLEAVTSQIEIPAYGASALTSRFSSDEIDQAFAQHGARMVPIRSAAVMPLVPIAPNERLLHDQGDSVSGALSSASDRQLGFAVEYTKAATIVSLHDSPNKELLAADPIENKSSVTVRVTYLFHCTIPVVRALMCGTIAAAASRGMLATAVAYKTGSLAGPDARFKLLSATATLPNQGADYLPRGLE